MTAGDDRRDATDRPDGWLRSAPVLERAGEGARRCGYDERVPRPLTGTRPPANYRPTADDTTGCARRPLTRPENGEMNSPTSVASLRW